MIPHAPSEVKAGPRAAIGYQFRPLPIEHFPDRRISSTAKLLLAVLLDNARRRGACKLCNRTLAEMIGRSVATVKRLLAELEAAGLAERETIAGGRVRLGIVARPGVAHSRSLDARTVAQDQSAGGSPAARGVAHSLATIQSSCQSETQSGGILPLVEDPGMPPDPVTAAAYLRACIDAGRRGVDPPAPPTGGCSIPPTPVPVLTDLSKAPAPVFANCETPAAAKGVATGKPPKGVHETDAPPSGPRYGDPRREVRSMVERLANGLTAGPVRPRRLTPAQLQRQLEEVRRRHGAGKTSPRA